MEDQDHQRVVVAVAYPDMVVDHQRVVVAVGLSPLALPALVVDHQQNLRLVDHQRVVLAVALSPLVVEEHQRLEEHPPQARRQQHR